MANMATQRATLKRFGNWHFDTDSGILSSVDSTTRLEPQVANLLEYFLNHQNQLLRRDDLIAEVWGGRIVSDDAINRCVSVLRKVLTPQDKGSYIETVVRRGYITHFPPAPATSSLPTRQPIQRISKALMDVFLVFALVTIVVYVSVGSLNVWSERSIESPNESAPVVAVLPFSNGGAGGDSEFFAKGIHEDILTQLAKLQSMRVISSTSVKQYTEVDRDLRSIASKLGADAVLEGSIQVTANQIRINAQLIDAQDDEHLWAETYDRELTAQNIFAVQSEIARAISSALHTTLTTQDMNQLVIIPTNNMAAYRAYHRAMQFPDQSGRFIEESEVTQALEEAVQLDPNFSRAWAELVSVLAFRNFSGKYPEMTVRAEQALQSLFEIAPDSTDYLFGQASYVYYTLKDYDLAHILISQTIVKNPSDVRAIEMRSWIERRQGDFAAAIDSLKELRKLDPLNEKWGQVLLSRLLVSHRYDEFWEQAKRTPFPESRISKYANSLKEFHENRNFKQFQDAMRANCLFGSAKRCGWEESIAARDYSVALDIARVGVRQEHGLGIEHNDRQLIKTHLLMENMAQLEDGFPRWQNLLSEGMNGSGVFHQNTLFLDSALLAVVQGNYHQAEKAIEGFLHARPFDWAERAARRHEACRILGLIAATRAAVNCIRDGLGEPSYVVPFLEPYLPFYDSFRDEPEFRKLVNDIDPEGSLKVSISSQE